MIPGLRLADNISCIRISHPYTTVPFVDDAGNTVFLSVNIFQVLEGSIRLCASCEQEVTVDQVKHHVCKLNDNGNTTETPTGSCIATSWDSAQVEQLQDKDVPAEHAEPVQETGNYFKEYHCKKSQFDIEGAGTACTAMAASAAVFFHKNPDALKRLDEDPEKMMELILNNGARHYDNVLRLLNLNVLLLNAVEVCSPPFEYLLKRNYKRIIDHVQLVAVESKDSLKLSNMYDESSTSLRDALKYFLSSKRYKYAIFTANGASMAILKQENKVVYIDSHLAKSKAPGSKGGASAVVFGSSNAITGLHDLLNTKEPFSLTPIVVTEMEKITAYISAKSLRYYQQSRLLSPAVSAEHNVYSAQLILDPSVEFPKLKKSNAYELASAVVNDYSDGIFQVVEDYIQETVYPCSEEFRQKLKERGKEVISDSFCSSANRREFNFRIGHFIRFPTSFSSAHEKGTTCEDAIRGFLSENRARAIIRKNIGSRTFAIIKTSNRLMCCSSEPVNVVLLPEELIIDQDCFVLNLDSDVKTVCTILSEIISTAFEPNIIELGVEEYCNEDNFRATMEIFSFT